MSKLNNLSLKNNTIMETEIKYVAPWAEVLKAHVEKGFVGTNNELPGTGEEEVW